MARRLLLGVMAVLAACSIETEGKTFTRCQLVRELRRNGFPRSQLANWVCLVEAESGRRTHIISKPNSNKSRDYGLFQINDNYWCSSGARPGKDCNVRCRDLITDNISKASSCAKKIYKRHGFNAWYGWKNKCKSRALPNISKC